MELEGFFGISVVQLLKAERAVGILVLKLHFMYRLRLIIEDRFENNLKMEMIARAKFKKHLETTQIKESQTSSRLEKCCHFIIRILAYRPFLNNDLWFFLYDYRDVREKALWRMKSEWMIKKTWALDTVENRSLLIYQLNKNHPIVRQLLSLK
jgi:hypothetical protein